MAVRLFLVVVALAVASLRYSSATAGPAPGHGYDALPTAGHPACYYYDGAGFELCANEYQAGQRCEARRLLYSGSSCAPVEDSQAWRWVSSNGASVVWYYHDVSARCGGALGCMPARVGWPDVPGCVYMDFRSGAQAGTAGGILAEMSLPPGVSGPSYTPLFRIVCGDNPSASAACTKIKNEIVQASGGLGRCRATQQTLGPYVFQRYCPQWRANTSGTWADTVWSGIGCALSTNAPRDVCGQLNFKNSGTGTEAYSSCATREVARQVALLAYWDGVRKIGAPAGGGAVVVGEAEDCYEAAAVFGIAPNRDWQGYGFKCKTQLDLWPTRTFPRAAVAVCVPRTVAAGCVNAPTDGERAYWYTWGAEGPDAVAALTPCDQQVTCADGSADCLAQQQFQQTRCAVLGVDEVVQDECEWDWAFCQASGVDCSTYVTVFLADCMRFPPGLELPTVANRQRAAELFVAELLSAVHCPEGMLDCWVPHRGSPSAVLEAAQDLKARIDAVTTEVSSWEAARTTGAENARGDLAAALSPVLDLPVLEPPLSVAWVADSAESALGEGWGLPRDCPFEQIEMMSPASIDAVCGAGSAIGEMCVAACGVWCMWFAGWGGARVRSAA